MKRTKITATSAELRELFNCGDVEDDVLAGQTVIGVCAGEWRKEGPDLWRAWNEDDEADAD